MYIFVVQTDEGERERIIAVTAFYEAFYEAANLIEL